MDDIKLTRDEKRILHLVVNMGGEANYFRLHRRLFLTASQIGVVTRSLIEKNHVEATDIGIRLTEDGLRYAHKERARRTTAQDKVWLRVPIEFLAPQSDPFKPIAPSYKRFFKEKNSGKKFIGKV